VIPRYPVLARRIEAELAKLERTYTAIQKHWTAVDINETDKDAYLNSVGLGLHSLYSGLERLFELIAVELDGGPLGGDAWHIELLRQMTLDVPDVRPAVLSATTMEQLDEYRRFRHLIRNIYATDLDPERMRPLVSRLPKVWSEVVRDLAQFIRFLYNINRTDEKANN
jgi:hypothetical protein